MLDTFFQGIFDRTSTTVISPGDFLLCVVVSLLIGFFLSFCYTIHSQYSKSFVATLALLPAMVCVVIMMVNGNVGTGVAVAGAFSLVRFRSVAGSAKEIGAIFLAMTTGLMTGMGYLGYALLAALILGCISVLCSNLSLGNKGRELHKTLRIVIPEDLDYADIFEDIFEEYTSEHELVRVKTTNMGSLFSLTYTLTMKELRKDKEMIDKLRLRNGNLEISLSKQETVTAEL